MSVEPVVIKNARIALFDRVVEGAVSMEGGVVTDVGERVPEPDGATVIDADGSYVVPGFVNMHVHGGVGFDTGAGLFDPDTKRFDPSRATYARMLPKVAAHFARHGVTRALLATVAMPEERLVEVGGLVADYVFSDRNGVDGCFLDGIFLEGTFIKDPAFAGAQNPEFFHELSVFLAENLNHAARGCIRYALVAPEWGESAVDMVEHMTKRGVVAGAGHTACTADQYRATVEKGLRVAVHLTNGPTGSSTKPFNGGGALEASLTLDEVYAELIMDAYHIRPGYVMDIIARKGIDKICLVTDAMFATEAEGVTDFEIEGIAGELSATGEYLRVLAKEGTLFGSVLTMDRGVQNALKWLTGGLSGVWTRRHDAMAIEEAVIAVTRFASANPARALDIFAPSDARDLADCVGSLEPGKRADVTLMRVEGAPGDLSVSIEKVYVAGRCVVDAPAEGSGRRPSVSAAAASPGSCQTLRRA